MTEFVNRSERRMRRTHESSEGSGGLDEASLLAPVKEGVDPNSSSLWRPMDDDALTGRPIIVRSADGQTAEVYRHPTRKYDVTGMMWVKTHKWALRNASGSYLWFEPVEYMLIP